MGITLLSIGSSALSANYAALQTIGNNIANVNTVGYSRQEAVMQTATGRQTAQGFLGGGVDVSVVSRAHSALLSRQVLTTQSQASLDSTHLDLLNQLETAFPTGESGVGYAATEFLGATSELSSSPSDTSVRQTVLARAGDLARRFADAGAQMDGLQHSVTADLKLSVDSVNDTARNVAQLNGQITQQMVSGQPPNDLLDKRDQLLQQLSGYMQLTTMSESNGAVSVFIAGGQQLVGGTTAQTLKVQPDTLDPTRSALALADAQGHSIAMDSSALQAGGSIGAMLRFQNQDLVSARNRMGQMATAFSAAVNEQQGRGLALIQPTSVGQAVFTDFVKTSQSGQLKGLGAVTNSRDGAGNPAASVSIKISDASLLEAEDYTLEASGDGSFVMTRGSDGARFSTADGSTFVRENTTPSAAFNPGFTLDINGKAAAGDRFLLQPVGHAAADMAVVMTNPSGLAAASPFTAAVSSTNKGTAAVAGLEVTGSVDASKRLQGTVKITDASTGAFSYDWKQLDASGVQVDGGTTTGNLTADKELVLGNFKVKLSGSLQTDDVVNVATTANLSSSNGNAKALAALGSQALVGRSSGANGKSGGASITDAYAGAMSNVGLRVQSASTASEISSGVAQGALNARNSQSGVSLDEEAARMLQYQQSYQAAAKVLAAAQSVFDSLLQAVSR